MFTTADHEIASRSKALGHPARIAILRILAQRQTCLCGEIVEGLPLAQSTVSQHLKILREAGLITGEIDGPRSCYCIERGALRRLRAELDELLAGLERATSCCFSESPTLTDSQGEIP